MRWAVLAYVAMCCACTSVPQAFTPKVPYEADTVPKHISCQFRGTCEKFPKLIDV